MAPIEPGTYKITNVKTGTVLAASDGDPAGAVFCWQRLDETTQKWFVQRSGAGWRFKNCKSGLYLTASNTEEYSDLYYGRYPISWELTQGPQDHDVHIIKFAGCDRLVDLKGGGAHNGNGVSLFHRWEPGLNQRWKFERLNDDTGEDDQRLFREIAERDQQIVDKTRRLVDKDIQLADKYHQLTQMAGRLVTQSQEAALVLQSTQAQLAEVTERLKSKDQELDRLRRNDLRPCGEPSGKHACRDALSQANDTIRDRDIELLKLQNQMLREKMENEAYRQQLETRELRENMAKLEQLVAQSMDTLGPGVFKIINAASDTALTVSEGNSGRVFCWERHQGVTQRWFMQPSGSGWRIKNYGTGEYLTVSNTNNVSEVYCGKYPISWELAQGPEDHDMYMIKFAGCDRIFDLHDCDTKRNGNKVYLCRQLDWKPHRRWKFERLSDNPEEEAQLFSREIALKDRWLAEKDQQLVLKGQQLADRGEQLADERRQLLEMAGRLAIQGKEIERIEVDRRRIQDQLAGVTERLAAKDQELDRLRRNSPGSSRRSAERTSGDAPSQFNDTVERLELQIQALREGLENETSRQQREIAELREKVTNLEGLLAQLNRDTVQPNNSID